MTISSSYGLRLPQIHHDIHDINANEMKWNFRTEDKLSMNILVLPGIYWNYAKSKETGLRVWIEF